MRCSGWMCREVWLLVSGCGSLKCSEAVKFDGWMVVNLSCGRSRATSNNFAYMRCDTGNNLVNSTFFASFDLCKSAVANMSGARHW